MTSTEIAEKIESVRATRTYNPEQLFSRELSLAIWEVAFHLAKSTEAKELLTSAQKSIDSPQVDSTKRR